EARPQPQTAHGAQDAQGDVHRVAVVVRRPAQVGDQGLQPARLAAGAFAGAAMGAEGQHGLATGLAAGTIHWF
ncbi:MAG: hypothetical protein HY744_28395, partial [Deltaproteobacteria bacterium]|nr:hypothetical protein [Deltaproteobacteria bacterium]